MREELKDWEGREIRETKGTALRPRKTPFLEMLLPFNTCPEVQHLFKNTLVRAARRVGEVRQAAGGAGQSRGDQAEAADRVVLPLHFSEAAGAPAAAPCKALPFVVFSLPLTALHCLSTPFSLPVVDRSLHFQDVAITELSVKLGEEWRALTAEQKAVHDSATAKDMAVYEKAMRKYNRSHDSLASQLRAVEAQAFGSEYDTEHESHLFNKVVVIEDHPHAYFFVLTYIPDL